MITESIKERFYIPDGTYLLSHSIGCLPVAAEKLLSEKYFRPWADYGGNAWVGWLDNLNRFNSALATLFNSNPEQFCPQVNLSASLTKILFSLPVSAHRNKVVFSERDFPSIGNVVKKFCEIRGLLPVMIPRGRNLSDLQVWRDFLDKDVAAALVTHVISDTSQRLPVKDITMLCRDQEVVSIVDVAQSAGIVPVDLSGWQANFVIGSCVKWLCGGAGAGFLWGDKDIIHKCKPEDIGWFSHHDPMTLGMNNFNYASDAKRFAGGTPSVIPFTLAVESINLMLSIGIENIHRHNQYLIDRLVSTLDVSAPGEPENRGGTLVISFSNNQEALQKLTSAEIYCDLRKEGLRFSPHVYNTVRDIDRLAELILNI